MHLRLYDIQWDCDGMRPVEDCLLPISIIVINAPKNWEGDYVQQLEDELSEVYGFMHYGFKIEPYNLDGRRSDGPYRQAKPWSEVAHAMMEAPEPHGLGNFGDFLQKVCSDLVARHQWDDPYGSLTPQYDPQARWLDLIHEHYHLGSDSGHVADLIHKENGGD